MTTVVLTIAGSDPSGGAGIQADLRTFAALGVVGVSAITALTVQNTLGVQAVYPVPADVLTAQLEAIFSDTKVQAVKIGMLGGADQVRAVAAALRKYDPPNVVLDPVLASTGGIPLLDDEGRAALLTELMPLCDLVTPNLAEAQMLTSQTVGDLDTMQAAGEWLMGRGARAVLVKGGHLAGEPVDLLVQQGLGPTQYRGHRIETEDTHGTGCLLSSISAAYLAADGSLEEMIGEAKSLLTLSLQHPVRIGKGRGYPSVERGVQHLGVQMTHAQRLALLRGIYVVTDTVIQTDHTQEDILAAATGGGACAVQAREKSLSTRALTDLATGLVSRGKSKDTLIIVNDRVDVALASNADGVHLGPDDMAPADARRLLGPDKLVGVSVATVEEAEAAAPYASYFGVGAIFGTMTKSDAGAAIGVGRIGEIKAAFPNIPVVAIGGINAGNIVEVARAGADAAAVVSAVVAAPDMEAATRELVALFAAGKVPS